MLQNILILNILSLCKRTAYDASKYSGLCAHWWWVWLCFCSWLHLYILGVVMWILPTLWSLYKHHLIAFVLGVSCLLTLSVNKCDVILNYALFFSDLFGSIEAVKMSRSTISLNSLTAIDGHDRQYFNELRSTVVSCRIFIRSQSLIARWTRNDFSSPAVSRDFYEAFLIDDMAKGSKSYLFRAS
jgi:hypothetical protein